MCSRSSSVRLCTIELVFELVSAPVWEWLSADLSSSLPSEWWSDFSGFSYLVYISESVCIRLTTGSSAFYFLHRVWFLLGFSTPPRFYSFVWIGPTSQLFTHSSCCDLFCLTVVNPDNIAFLKHFFLKLSSNWKWYTFTNTKKKNVGK